VRHLDEELVVAVGKRVRTVRPVTVGVCAVGAAEHGLRLVSIAPLVLLDPPTPGLAAVEVEAVDLELAHLGVIRHLGVVLVLGVLVDLHGAIGARRIGVRRLDRRDERRVVEREDDREREDQDRAIAMSHKDSPTPNH